jgi:2-polyprenyl-3-methyl-5-hydroxy-6-metoxy-1,4-benzoquinol methylase
MNGIKSLLYCPACGEKSVYLVDWEYSGLNDSIFNYTANFYECPYCGLAYIANITDERLSIFYAKECSYFEKSHFDISAPENIQKYKYYREILVKAGLSDTPITDVGCGRGGFLIWLKNNGWNAACQGVDNDLKSLPNIKANTYERGVSLSFQEGTASALPFANGSQSLLTYFHVLEHIVNLDKVLKEAFRVLNGTGHIMIEVPDAERYKDFPIGTAFWISIREHIYHFSPSAICNTLYRNGFSVISINRNLMPTPEFSYPSLIILARKGDTKREPDISKSRDIASFIIQSKKDLKSQALQILKFSQNFSSITFWGCSPEFFSLLPIMNLQHFTLCDSSKIKQKCYYRGIPINNPASIQKKGALMVASYLHGDVIEKAAIELGWSKEAIFRLRYIIS